MQPLQSPSESPVAVILVMGVSGSGKSTFGAALAERLGWRFIEGDAFHPPENVAKMAAGMPLDDGDREGWLAALGREIAAHSRGRPAVLACSALKRAYRDLLRRAQPDLRLVYLGGDRAVIAGRLASRSGHFMPPALLDSQFATLEPPEADEAPVVVDIGRPAAETVAEVAAAL